MKFCCKIESQRTRSSLQVCHLWFQLSSEHLACTWNDSVSEEMLGRTLWTTDSVWSPSVIDEVIFFVINFALLCFSSCLWMVSSAVCCCGGVSLSALAACVKVGVCSDAAASRHTWDNLHLVILHRSDQPGQELPKTCHIKLLRLQWWWWCKRLFNHSDDRRADEASHAHLDPRALLRDRDVIVCARWWQTRLVVVFAVLHSDRIWKWTSQEQVGRRGNPTLCLSTDGVCGVFLLAAQYNKVPFAVYCSGLMASVGAQNFKTCKRSDMFSRG